MCFFICTECRTVIPTPHPCSATIKCQCRNCLERRAEVQLIQIEQVEQVEEQNEEEIPEWDPDSVLNLE